MDDPDAGVWRYEQENNETEPIADEIRRKWTEMDSV